MKPAHRIQLLAVIALLLTALPSWAQVKAWEATIDLPTDEEGPPDVNPPFDLFVTGKFNYPYTLARDTHGTADRSCATATLDLENEYLKRGRAARARRAPLHLHRQVERARRCSTPTRSIRKAQIGYRGAWAAYGIEFNFPVSHNWVSMSPVDFATAQEPRRQRLDLGGQRRPGLRHAVAGRAAPAPRAAPSSSSTSPSTTRARCAVASTGGTTPAVRVHDDSRDRLPDALHGVSRLPEVDTWPVNSRGIDLSIVGNHLDGPVSLFSHGSREAVHGRLSPLVAAPASSTTRRPRTRPRRRSGPWAATPTASTGGGRSPTTRAPTWRSRPASSATRRPTASSEPQETIRFTEYWMPVREIGGITRANPEAVVHLAQSAGQGGPGRSRRGREREPRGCRRPPAHLRRRTGVSRRRLSTSRPKAPSLRTFPGLPSSPRYTVTLLDPDGRVLLAHTEDGWDYAAGRGDQARTTAVPLLSTSREAERGRRASTWAMSRSEKARGSWPSRPTRTACGASPRASPC